MPRVSAPVGLDVLSAVRGVLSARGLVRAGMTRRLRYQVAVSLDGFIAGPNHEAYWIVMDPSIDFGALFAEFDTLDMGRKTHEVMAGQPGQGAVPGVEVYVFSRTLPASSRRGV